jgi:hypothetical protein
MSGGKRDEALRIDAELKAMGKEFEKFNEAGDEEAAKALEAQILAKIDEGKALVEYGELGGKVVINKLDYEAFSVGIKLKSGTHDIHGNPIPEEQREVLKEYVMPEGFTLWFQIVFDEEEVIPTSLF